MKGYRYFLVSMERGDSYLSTSTNVIRIGGFTLNVGGGGNHPCPFGRHVTKNDSARGGLIQTLQTVINSNYESFCKLDSFVDQDWKC